MEAAVWKLLIPDQYIRNALPHRCGLMCTSQILGAAQPTEAGIHTIHPPHTCCERLSGSRGCGQDNVKREGRRWGALHGLGLGSGGPPPPPLLGGFELLGHLNLGRKGGQGGRRGGNERGVLILD